LEELNVGVASIEDVGAMNLSDLTNPKRLTLRRNKITDAGIGTLVDLTGLGLNVVHLYDHGMASVVIVSSLPSLTDLQSLNLSYTQITNRGFMSSETFEGDTEEPVACRPRGDRTRYVWVVCGA